jgi:hypothetical protein
VTAKSLVEHVVNARHLAAPPTVGIYFASPKRGCDGATGDPYRPRRPRWEHGRLSALLPAPPPGDVAAGHHGASLAPRASRWPATRPCR